MKMADLLQKKNVVLAYTDKKVMWVGVTQKVPLAQLKREDRVPRKIMGRETHVFETTMPQALPTWGKLTRTTRHRPAPGGVSIGHPDVTAGTLGMRVIKGGAPHILSNKHVLAPDGAAMGDQTWQPGSYHGGSVADIIGHLSDWAPIQYLADNSDCPLARIVTWVCNGLARLFHRKTRLSAWTFAVNRVDCAISRPLLDDDVSPKILEAGTPEGYSEAAVEDTVIMSGCTSGLQTAKVIATDGVATVSYGPAGHAVFEDQLITEPIAHGGDSGSVILNNKKEVVGLIFAGSDSVSIANKISNVIAALGLERTL